MVGWQEKYRAHKKPCFSNCHGFFSRIVGGDQREMATMVVVVVVFNIGGV